MSEKKAEAGEYIYREADNADQAYVVVSGKVELFDMSNGNEIPFNIIEPGKAFGELAVFDTSARIMHVPLSQPSLKG